MLKNAIFQKIVYDRSMIKIIAGGKKHIPEIVGLISEYEKRLKKPFWYQMAVSGRKKARGIFS